MKRILISLLFCVFMTSCNKSRKKLIPGKWNLTYNAEVDTSKQWNYYKDGTSEIIDYKNDTSYRFRYELINRDSTIEFFYPDTISYRISKLKNDILIIEHYGISFVFKRK